MRGHIKLKLNERNVTFKRKVYDKYKDKLGYDETAFTTDDNGFIITPDARSGTKPVYLLGDSFIECSFVPEGKRISDHINRVFQTRNPDYQAYNGGSSGSSILHLYNIYINLIAYQKDAIIMVFPGGITSIAVGSEDELWKPGYFYPFTDDCGEVISTKCDIPLEYSNVKKLICAFISTARIFEQKIIFGIPPSRHPNLDIMNDILMPFYQEQSIDFVDLREVAADKDNLMYDSCHCNSQGARLIGEYLGNYIIDNVISATNPEAG